MSRDLPGFYYDAEKNRYFPVKGPIPGSARTSSSSTSRLAAREKSSKPTHATNSRPRSAAQILNLLQVRELYGKVIASKKAKYTFNEELRRIQASRPVVWKYSTRSKVSDGALEHIHIDVQGPEGQREAATLMTGGLDGMFSIYEAGNVGQFSYEDENKPHRIWPSIPDKETEDGGQVAEHILRQLTGLEMQSSVSCIKKYQKSIPDGDNISNIRRALIYTLGSGRSGGSVYHLNLAEPLDLDPSRSRLLPRVKKLAAFNCTIWTADCDFHRDKTVVGTSVGAMSVDLMTGKSSLILRCKSDVLAEQVIQSGKVVLCGLRNGLILTVDIREKPRGRMGYITHQIPYSYVDGTSRTQRIGLAGMIYPSRAVKMASSISSLLSLQFDDQYFLASSMDGSVKLYDHRLTQRGAVQSYEGHVNSCNRIQLGVDPDERFVFSGGEDCHFRLWGIRTGELLFDEKFSDSVISTASWHRVGRDVGVDNESQGDEDPPHAKSCNSGAWLGSRDGLYHIGWPIYE